jgi:multidrug efflux pump subunit AcrB
MREGHNGLDLGAALDKEVGTINAGFPVGMSLTKVTDQAVNIRSSVDEFMLKFFVALGVVLLVCFVSMGWRVGIVVAAAVPLTLASVFVVMSLTTSIGLKLAPKDGSVAQASRGASNTKGVKPCTT